LENECVSSADSTSRRCEHLACEHAFLVDLFFGCINAMSKCCVNYYDHVVELMLTREVTNGLVELRERRRGATFSCDVRAVHD
jgi:hypothetical protein